MFPAMSQPGTPRPGTSPPARPGPLAGLVVADFSRVLAGPYCTMLLADLGADVIKVESPGGDDTRHWVPPVTEDGVSTYFLAINRNKRSVVLDLREEGQRALAQELARRADIFVQNFKPGGLARFGLDYESVRAANPAIIYASISGFGAGGGKDLPGYDLMVQAKNLKQLFRALQKIIVGHIAIRLRYHQQPFHDLPRAPEKYWAMFRRSRLELPAPMFKLRLLRSRGIVVAPPRVRVATANAA